MDGRGDRIRTYDLLVPNQALYQAKLHPERTRASGGNELRADYCPVQRAQSTNSGDDVYFPIRVRFMGGELEAKQAFVGLATFDELRVSSLVEHAALVHYDDLIRFQNRRESVGNGHDCPVFAEDLKSVFKRLLGICIQVGSGFVEEQDGGVSEDGARDGDSLELSAREVAAFVADGGLISVGLAEDELLGPSHAGCVVDVVLGGFESTIADVIFDGVVEEEQVLIDDPDLVSEGVLLKVAEVVTIEENSSGLGVVEAENEGDEGTFSRAAFADEGVEFTRLEVEVEVLDGWSGAGAIGKSDVFEAEVALSFLKRDRIGRVGDFWRFIEHFEHLLGGCGTAVGEHLHAAEGLDVRVEHDEQADPK